MNSKKAGGKKDNSEAVQLVTGINVNMQINFDYIICLQKIYMEMTDSGDYVNIANFFHNFLLAQNLKLGTAIYQIIKCFVQITWIIPYLTLNVYKIKENYLKRNFKSE